MRKDGYEVKIRSGLPLGLYKTREMAQCVMDEIENHINLVMHVKLFGNLQYFKGYVGDIDSGMIFTMPKEEV